MSRKKARIGQMQALFQMEANKDFSKDCLDLFIENSSFSEDEKEYIEENTIEAMDYLESIDKTIIDNLQNWSFNRLANVDKAILRISVYEILYKEDIPAEVSINEAVEISKEYGSNESPKFINGVLGSIYRSLNQN